MSVSALRSTFSPVMGFLPRTAIRRSQPRVLLASSASGLSTASFTNLITPSTRLLPKAMRRSMGSVKIAFARSQTSPRWKMSRQPSESRKRVMAFLIVVAERPSLVIWSSTQAPTFSKMPYPSRAWVIRAAPGISSMTPRTTLAVVRGTLLMLIGLTPSTTVNSRYPGIRFALSAK